MSERIDTVWQRVLRHEGETFRQIRGGEFTYRVNGALINLSRTNQHVSRAQMEQALELVPLAKPSIVQHLRAPSYIYAILMDDRIRGADW